MSTMVRKIGISSNSPLARRLNISGGTVLRKVAPAAKKVVIRKPAAARQPGVVVHKQFNGIKFRNMDVKAKFNPSMLDLGNLNIPCEEKSAIAAVFDLTGFTKFCNQVDAYLEIPRFLNHFLTWFFSCIVQGLTEEDDGEKSTFWADLPMLVKFLGDGLLIIWNSQRMTSEQACRLVATLYNICKAYNRDFYPQISAIVNKPPSILRCGIARGRVFSIGGGRDYVGHCINNASRLSHLDGLTFGFPHRGFQVKDDMPPDYARLFVPKFVNIKGVGENELIWLLKDEFEKLPEEKKKIYRDFDEVMGKADK